MRFVRFLETVYWYRRLRRAYKKHLVLPYSRRKTWGEARFTTRMKRLP